MASGAVSMNTGQEAVPKMPPTPPSRGYTGASLSGSQRPTTAERLTPMPDYMHPVTRSSAKRFRKLHEDHMMDKLMHKRSAKKERNIQTRDEGRALARKIPIEVLARDWFNDNQHTVETRAFLVDKIMPTLILGVEKLLVEVERLGLADTDTPDANFNPINFLAQYLMRNNPKYSNFCEASPYVRGLRAVTEELRVQLFDLDENRLARIKADAKRKRESREYEDRMRQMEQKRRNDLLVEQFAQWHSGPQSVDPRVPLALLQNALRSFQEVAEMFPEPQKSNARYNNQLDPTDDTGRDIGQREFILYVTSFVDEMSSDMFDHFIRHMSNCAYTHVSQADRVKREAILEQLFKQCDHTGVGLIDRHRILNLFKMFYDKASEEVKEILRNPRKWPVVDVDEIDSYYDSDEEGEGSRQKTSSSEDGGETVSEVVKVTSQAGSKEKTEGVEGKEEPGEETNSGDDAASQAKSDEKEADEKEGEKEAEKEEEDEDAEKTEKEAKPENEAAKQDGAEPKMKDSEAGADPVETKPAEEDQAKWTVDSVGESTTVGGGRGEKGESVADSRQPEGASLLGEDNLGSESAKDKPEVPEPNENGDGDGGGVGVGGEGGEKKGDPELAKLMSAKTSVISGRPPMTQQSKVSFAEGTTFEKERALLTSHGTRSKSQASTFDENTVNQSQFSQLTETFLGDIVNIECFQQLVRYIRDGYVETEDERRGRLLKARGEVQSAKRKALLNSIFDMWDNEGSGYLDLDEVFGTMKKYKDGMENAHIDRAKKEFKEKSEFADQRLSKREFRTLVYGVVSEMGGGDALEFFLEFLLNSVERSYQERLRGEARKKWLQHIIDSGETSAARMEPVYKAIFQALYKDAEAHGQSKRISAYVALLERNDVAPERGDTLLRYTGATLDHSDRVLNKALFRDMKGVSFACVDSGKPIHVPRVASHGNIYFWDPNKPADGSDGAFIVVPLKDRRKRTFGVFGVDTLGDNQQNRVIFITHEIQFYQGVAKAFSIAYHHVDVRVKTMRISESAISWIHRRSPSVHEITIYMMEPDGKGQDYVLRRMMATDEKGMAVLKKIPDRLERKDNLFRDYLFKCVDNSESVTADAYGERHLAIPLRDDEGRAIVVVDISIGSVKALPKAESREVMKMLKLLQLAYKEISRETREGEKNNVLEAEQGVDDETRTEILFDKLMLVELRDNVSRLDAQAYAELKSYKEPPPVVHQIIKAVLAIFYPDMAKAEEFESWDKCKKYVNPGLGGKIMAFDPTSSEANAVNADNVNKQLADVPHGMVLKHGSFPAQFLYNWVFVCVSLIEHTRKMQANRQQIVDEMNQDENATKAEPQTEVKKDSTTVQDTAETEKE